MKRRRPGSPVSVLVGAMLLTAAGAQTPVSELVEQVEVSLHLIDVAVTDRKGRPITGLDAADFVVRIDGKQREIVSVDATSAAGAPAASRQAVRPPVAPGVEPPGAGRWVLIGLDADRISATHRGVALATAEELVAQGGPRDRFALVLIKQGEARFLHEFAPVGRFERAVFDSESALASTSTAIRFRLDELNDLMESCAGSASESACVHTRSAEFTSAVHRETSEGVRAISGLIAAMAAIPGRKAFVLFSDGLVLDPGEVALDAARRYTSAADRVRSRVETDPLAYERLLAEATRAGVTFFAMRTGRDLGDELLGAGRSSRPRENVAIGNDPFRTAQRAMENSLRSIAEATGGAAVFTPLDRGTADGLLDRLDGVYTLGVPAHGSDGPRSKVRVTLRGIKGSVSVWKRLPAFAAATRPVDATLEVSVPPAEAFTGEVRVRLRVPLSGLARDRDQAGGSETSRVAVFARLIATDGTLLTDYYRILEVPRPSAATEPFVHPLVFRVAPGTYVAQVFASDLIGRGSVTVSSTFTAPASTGSPAAPDEAGGRPRR